MTLTECPACGAKRGRDWKRFSAHLIKHTPEELGLFATALPFRKCFRNGHIPEELGLFATPKDLRVQRYDEGGEL